MELNVGVQYDLTEECRQNFEPGAEQGYRSFCQPVVVNHPHHILASRDYVAEHLRPPTMLLVKRQSLLLQHVQAQTYLVEGYWFLPLEALRHGFEHVYGDQDNFVSVDGLRVDLEEEDPVMKTESCIYDVRIHACMFACACARSNLTKSE